MFYSTIYILCRVAACGGGGEGVDERRGESESVSADVLSVLCEDLKLMNGIIVERG